uniref:Uncharacterized protein LOC105125483 n=1 Tax=Rhizophora mucronata TaxID=61149 RepID=A0A2P2JK75_RHIMU
MHVDKTERDRRKVHQKHWQKLSGLKKLANSSSIIRRIPQETNSIRSESTTNRLREQKSCKLRKPQARPLEITQHQTQKASKLGNKPTRAVDNSSKHSLTIPLLPWQKSKIFLR